jgi:Cu+-exporting ATPase
LDLAAEAGRLEENGNTVVVVAADGTVLGLIALADQLKPSSRVAVSQLRVLGLTPVMLTGDNERTARAVAAAVGIDRVLYGALPEGKAAEVRRLQEAGEVVAMVGDGVNDAPALAQADLGLSIGTGTDVAIEASDLTLVSGDLRVAADAIRLARRTLRTIRGNLFWAMAGSSVFVVTNSLRLRRFRPLREAL